MARADNAKTKTVRQEIKNIVALQESKPHNDLSYKATNTFQLDFSGKDSIDITIMAKSLSF